MTVRDHREDGVVQVPQGITRVTISFGQSAILSLVTELRSDFASTLKILVFAPFGNSHASGLRSRLVWSDVLATPWP